MKSALLVTDLQVMWAQRSPRTAKAIEDAVREMRPHMPVLFAYAGLGESKDVQQAANIEGLKKLFNLYSGDDIGAVIENPAPEDWILFKKGMSPFSGQKFDLKYFLKEREIRHLYLAGFLASEAVLFTAREARREGFGVTVLSDLTSDLGDTALSGYGHQLLARQRVGFSTAEDWKKSLRPV